MFLKINSIRSRLILYCVSLVLFSLFIVSSFFYFSLAHSWRKQDYVQLEAQTHYFHELFTKNKLNGPIVNGELLVVIFRGEKRVFSHFPQYLTPHFGEVSEVDRFELNLIQSLEDKVLLKKGIKTILLLDGDEDETWEKMEVRLTQGLLDIDLKTLATFIDDDFFEIYTKEMANGEVVAVGKFNEEREEKLADLRYLALISFFPCLLLTIILSYLISRSFLNPIEDLLAVIRRMQQGEKNLRVTLNGRNDEMELLKKEFNHLTESNEALVKSLKETLDNVAHDLKTPLTHFRMSAEDAIRHSDEATLKEALGEAVESSELILQILRSLMDIQEVESGTLFLRKEELDLSHLISEAIEMYSFVAEDKKVRITSELRPVTLWADQSRLFQVVSNLLDNAIKFSAPEQEILVSLEAQDSQAIISVKDQGCGIPAESIKRVWERFYRSETSRHSPGAGIGLSLVHAYVKAHGGMVEVTSQENRGSEFRVVLPFCNPAER